MKTVIKSLVVLALLCIPFTGNSQINLKKKIETQTNNRANQRANQGVNKGLDAVESGIKGAFKKDDNSEQSKQQTQESKENQPAGGNDANAATTSDAGNQLSGDKQSSLQAYSRYDFVPGDKVLLFEDFSQDAVGDFPALWTTDVAGEINTINIAPGNWFNLNSGEGTYWFMKDIDFPQNFILEMDIVPKKQGGRFAADVVFFGESSHSEMDKAGDPGTGGLHIKIETNIWETAGYKKGVNEKLTGSSSVNLVETEKVNHVMFGFRTVASEYIIKAEKYWTYLLIFMKGPNFHGCVSSFTGEHHARPIFRI